MTRINSSRALAQISLKIKALEKNTIRNTAEIGRLLHEASEACEHGEYMAWLEREFSWSYRTAVRYRDVYDFQKCHGVTFDDLNITASALYLIAGMKDDDEQVFVNVVMEAAKVGRITYQRAQTLIQEMRQRRLEADPPAEPEPAIEPEEIPKRPQDQEALPPERKILPPINPDQREPTPIPLVVSKGQVNANKARALADETLKDLEGRHSELSQAEIDMLVQEALEVAERWRRVSELVRTSSPNKRSHIQAIADKAETKTRH